MFINEKGLIFLQNRDYIYLLLLTYLALIAAASTDVSAKFIYCRRKK